MTTDWEQFELDALRRLMPKLVKALRDLRGTPGGTGHVCMLTPSRDCPKCKAEQYADLVLAEADMELENP